MRMDRRNAACVSDVKKRKSSTVAFALQIPRGPEDGPLCECPSGVDAAAASV